MKKLVKGFVLAAAVLIVLGIGLAVGGVTLLGGKAAAKTALAGYEFYFDEAGAHLNLDNYVGETASSMESFDEIVGIHLEAGAAEVQIVENDSLDQISVDSDGKYVIYTKDEVLYIENAEGARNSNYDGGKIYIEIPTGMRLREAELSLTAADATIQILNADKVSIEIGAGRAEIAILDAKEAEFEVGAGEILVNWGTVENCSAEIEVGNFSYRGAILKNAEVECDLGNVELVLDGAEKDYNYKLESEEGNISIGFAAFQRAASKLIENQGAATTLDLECNMGNISVDFKGGN